MAGIGHPDEPHGASWRLPPNGPPRHLANGLSGTGAGAETGTGSPGSADWPGLADDFFWLTHEDGTGKPRLNARDLGLGLAAALLGELAAGGRILPRAGFLVLLPEAQAPPPDALAHAVLDQIRLDPGRHDVRAWLLTLGRTAHDQVAGRLLCTGQVQRMAVRRRFRADAVRYVPVDRNEAAMPWARLSVRLSNLQALGTLDTFLAGLLVATGLDRWLLELAPRDARAYLQHLIAGLPPPLRELLANTEAVVGESVLGNRR